MVLLAGLVTRGIAASLASNGRVVANVQRVAISIHILATLGADSSLLGVIGTVVAAHGLFLERDYMVGLGEVKKSPKCQ